MAVDWELIDSAESLRTEFNVLAPDRDKSSDGSIGDSAHASSSSDHNPDETGATPFEDDDRINEVHAIDVTAKLNKSGWTMQKAVDIIVDRHARGVDNRLQNVIYNKKIYSASWGWTARTYKGSNPHIKHAHFGFRYTTAQERDTRPWGLIGIGGLYVSLPKKGDSGEDVSYWQYMYSRAKNMYPKVNFPNLVIDGEYGPATAAAFKVLWTAFKGAGKYDGSYVSGWLGMKIQEAVARHAVAGSLPEIPTTPIPDEKLKELVNAWMTEHVEDGFTVHLEDTKGRVVFE